jgi:hypothetical protein
VEHLSVAPDLTHKNIPWLERLVGTNMTIRKKKALLH